MLINFITLYFLLLFNIPLTNLTIEECSLDSDYVKLFFDYEMKDSEWNNLYWKITNDLIEEKLFSFDKTLYGDVDFEENEEERDKLIEEEGVYFRIHDCVTKKKEYTIAELLSYNKVFNEMPALEDLKEQDNSNLFMDDCMSITKLHLNAIKKLIVDEFDNDTKNNQSESSSSTNIPTKSKLTISLENLNKNKLFALTKARMRKVLGDLLLEELEMNHPVLLKIG
uniref:Uncharacterized protein n=1 Tax=Meloidogyne enterolobii TaxID=390850 RepID=A0A6V7VBV0_MELEN|nr:unnamed protein product [Meloidogyne enterolobii]